MISRLSDTSAKAENTVNFGRGITALVGLLAVGTLFVGTKADARPVQFHSVGGRWSHSYHSGWHRYWGGPSVGFYYAPTPVYVVPGYAAASYYSGPDFWYSNPSFGLNINLGGGGSYYGGGHYYRNRPVIVHERGWQNSGRYNSNHYSGSHYSGGNHYGGGSHSSGGRYNGGGHSRPHR